MAFRFALTSVLALRRRREEAEERALTSLLAELTSLRTMLDRIEAEMRSAAAERAHASPEQLQAVVLHERYARVKVLESGRAELAGRMAELASRRDEQQALYLAARRDRELLEEMERRQRSALLAARDRDEAKRLDDLFLSRRLSGS